MPLQPQQGAELFVVQCFYSLSHLKDLAVLRSRQDPVGSPADAANRQTWRSKKRGRKKRIRLAVKRYSKNFQLQKIWINNRKAATVVNKQEGRERNRQKEEKEG